MDKQGRDRRLVEAVAVVVLGLSEGRGQRELGARAAALATVPRAVLLRSRMPTVARVEALGTRQSRVGRHTEEEAAGATTRTPSARRVAPLCLAAAAVLPEEAVPLLGPVARAASPAELRPELRAGAVQRGHPVARVLPVPLAAQPGSLVTVAAAAAAASTPVERAEMEERPVAAVEAAAKATEELLAPEGKALEERLSLYLGNGREVNQHGELYGRKWL